MRPNDQRARAEPPGGEPEFPLGTKLKSSQESGCTADMGDRKVVTVRSVLLTVILIALLNGQDVQSSLPAPGGKTAKQEIIASFCKKANNKSQRLNFCSQPFFLTDIKHGEDGDGKDGDHGGHEDGDGGKDKLVVDVKIEMVVKLETVVDVKIVKMEMVRKMETIVDVKMEIVVDVEKVKMETVDSHSPPFAVWSHLRKWNSLTRLSKISSSASSCRLRSDDGSPSRVLIRLLGRDKKAKTVGSEKNNNKQKSGNGINLRRKRDLV
ncbi:hypothetical protein Baya_15948 [Bagarius yarrelli]|uniref:Uncharacterized protein n=1 Tax=Bagarius yarrelli TaxID=175774 RepID=A0A556VU30_BAGYA|nr:hypothetical protein Baya_15948 [Bagarius yarrelli]